MNRILTFITLLFVTKLLTAQFTFVEGIVVDYQTGKMLKDFRVGVKGVKNDIYTTQEGFFRICVPDSISDLQFVVYNNAYIDSVAFKNGKYRVMVGYKPTDFLAGLSIEELLEVEVSTHAKQEEKIKDIPASVVVISREEIKKYGYNTLEEILQNVPGLYMVEQYNWSGMTGIGVRGYFAEGSFSNMIVMVNGSLALREGYINQYILSRIGIPVEAIDRIEIVRGPMSVMYGSGAFFGAINIITMDNDNKVSNRIAVSYGSNNTTRSSARVEAVSEDINIALNIGFYDTNGVDKPYTSMTDNRLVDMPDGTTKTYLQSVGLSDGATTKKHLSRSIKHFSINATYKNLSFDIGHTKAQKGLLWIAPSPAKNGQNVHINGTDMHLKYGYPVNNKLTINGLFTYGIYNSISRYNILATQNTGFSDINSTLMIYEVNALFNPNRKIDMIVGLVRESMLNASNDVDIPQFNVANSSWRVKAGDNISDHAAYSQLAFRAMNRFQLIAGMRATRFGNYTYQRLINDGLPGVQIFEKEYSDKNIHLSGRLAGIAKITKNHILKLMWGTAIMAPNMRQNVTRLDLTGGERSTLKPAEITTYEFSYIATLFNMFYTNISVFRNKLYNLIESSGAPDKDGSYTVLTQNSGQINTTGVELSMQFNPYENLEFHISATYQKTKNAKVGWENIDVGYSPPFLGYFKATYKVNSILSVATNCYYVDGMKTSWEQQDFDPETGRRYGNDVPAYFCINANIIAKNVIAPGIELSLNATNLNNAKILYATNPSNQWANKGFVGYGRRFTFKVGYNF